MLIQFLLIFLICLGISFALIIPFRYNCKNNACGEFWLIPNLTNASPGLIWVLVIVVFQQISSRKLFPMDKNVGHREKNKFERIEPQGYILLTNRKLYNIVAFFFWWSNIFLGAFSLILRVIYSLVFGLLHIGRLDQSTIQRNYETMDAGYSTYLGFQALEENNSHPIMISAVQCFLGSPAGRRYRRRIAGLKDEVNLEVEKARKRKQIVRWRWYFAYMMIKNPSLIHERNKVRAFGTKKMN